MNITHIARGPVFLRVEVARMSVLLVFEHIRGPIY